MERAALSARVQLRKIFNQLSHEKCILGFNQRNFTVFRPSLAVFKTTETASKVDVEKKEDEIKKPFVAQKASWMSKFLGGQKMETGTESHSNRLAVKDVVYELTFHKVKPDSMDQYLDEYENLTHMIKKWNTGGDHIGSWTVEVGDLDEAIHLWRFKGGYQTLDHHKSILRNEQEFKDFRKRRNILLRSRVNQTLLAFSFWCNIQQRPGNNNIYELRSYTLKPGTMIDWGNSWAQGLKYRQTDHESVAGFFSHIGDLYKAHHLWAYESLAAREEVRDMAWEREGWHECVAYTVPLVHSMVSRILIPTSFSPLK